MAGHPVGCCRAITSSGCDRFGSWSAAQGMLQKRLHMRSSSTHLAPLGLMAVSLARLGRVLHVLKRPLNRRLQRLRARLLRTRPHLCPRSWLSGGGGGRRRVCTAASRAALVGQAALLPALCCSPLPTRPARALLENWWRCWAAAACRQRRHWGPAALNVILVLVGGRLGAGVGVQMAWARHLRMSKGQHGPLSPLFYPPRLQAAPLSLPFIRPSRGSPQHSKSAPAGQAGSV